MSSMHTVAKREKNKSDARLQFHFLGNLLEKHGIRKQLTYKIIQTR
jgi:hypothetical protein